MKSLRDIASTRLARGTFMGFYGQFVQIIVQFLAIPVFTTHWGLTTYGVWLILFTVPAMLALADLGLTVAGGNSLIAAIARGDFERGARLYASLRWAVAALGGVILALSAIFLMWIRPGTLGFAQATTGGHAFGVTMILLCYGCLALLNGISLAGFRAADAVTYSGFLYYTSALIEAALALGLVTAGAGIEAVAISYLAARIVITGVLALELRRLAPWLRKAGWLPHFAELRQLAGPAIASLVMTGANAVTIQGTVMVIGATLGPAAVPVFTTVRTLSRTALQFALRLNFASMPQYTVAAEQGNERRKAQLVMINVVAAIGILLPSAAAILLLGIPFVHYWTAGVVNPSFLLLALIVAAMVLNGIWVPISNLIMAVNQHAGYTYFYLAVAVLSVGFGALLVQRWGIDGMAAMLVVLELLMIIRVFILARRLHLADRAEMLPVWHQSLHQLRLFIARTKA